MPLYGKKCITTTKALTDLRPDEKIYEILYTKEQFRSKDDYEKRCALYKERAWMCQSTGHINLCHEEAWNSELTVKRSLDKNFLKCYEKTVLELVHHSTISLETLVDQAWLKIQQCLSVDENIALKFKASGKFIEAAVVSVDTVGVNANPTSNCSSPSSDKENSSGDTNTKKWVPPKLIPYKYSIKLKAEDKIINSVPAADICRQDKPPSKELLRLFIRTRALRSGTNFTGPWVVNEEFVKKYSLPSKYADFMLSPMKMAEMAKKAEGNLTKKRKLSSQSGSAAKLAKLSKIEKKNKGKKTNSKDNKKQGKLDANSMKRTSTGKSPAKKSKHLSNQSDSDDCALVKLKHSNSMEEDVPLNVLQKQLTPRKNSSLRESNEKTPTKNDSKSPSKTRKSPRIKVTPKKKSMKQMTLMEMSKNGSRTPNGKRSAESASPRIPGCITKLQKAMENGDKLRSRQFLRQAVKELSTKQRACLPENIRNLVQAQVDKIEEIKKLKSMSVEERSAYMQKKREDVKKKALEERRMRQQEKKQKFDDLELVDVQALPTPKLVPTPDGMPNELFGDVAMVTEFIYCYKGLLIPEEKGEIYSDTLMKSLADSKEGLAFLSKVVMILLQTLLQDQIAEDYSELNMPLRDIPVNPYTASELVRLCIRKQDVPDNVSMTSSASSESSEYQDDDVDEEIIQLLESTSFFELELSHKIKLLSGLCQRIMGTYSVQDFMEEKQQNATKLWKQKIAELKSKNDRIKDEKKKKAELKLAETLKKENETENGGEETEKKEDAETKEGLTISHFYGNKKDETAESSEPQIKEEDVKTDEDIVSGIKRRRLTQAQAQQERIEKEKQDKLRNEELCKERKLISDKENFEKAFLEGISAAKCSLRQIPIGTDRNHSRYWIFPTSLPGLYVEKGWVNSDVDYHVKRSDSDSDDDDDSGAESVSTNTTNEDKKSRKKQGEECETTWPHRSQNLWFLYNTKENMDALLESLLPKGIRESALKHEITKNYDDIMASINADPDKRRRLTEDDVVDDLLTAFKKELLDMELKLRNGGLGGVHELDTWEAKLNTSDGITQLGQCLMETQSFVTDRFLKGIMVSLKPKPKIQEIQDGAKNGESGDEKEDESRPTPPGVVRWKDAVENCQTLARLHLLLGMLDSCIKWEKSAENAKCKICRKSNDEDRLLLCDECNLAFHMFCLRPALFVVPKGEWFCPACVPQSQRRRNREAPRYFGSDETESRSQRRCSREAPRYTDLYESEDESSEEEEIEHETECAECGQEHQLVACSTCPSVYHIDCHDPPLRYPPRGRWCCSDCKDGVSRKTRAAKKNQRKSSRAAAAKRKQNHDSSSREDDSSEEDSSEISDEDEEIAHVIVKSKVKPATSTRGTSTKSRGTTTSRGPGNKPKPVMSDACCQTPLANNKKIPAPVDRTVKAFSGRTPSELSICEEVITRLMRHKLCWPFKAPVDKREVPDYYDLIKKPMDFQTIKNNCLCLRYSTPDEFLRDVALVFNNAAGYNKVDSEVHNCMEAVEKSFIELLKHMLPNLTYSRSLHSNGVPAYSYNVTKRMRRC